LAEWYRSLCIQYGIATSSKGFGDLIKLFTDRDILPNYPNNDGLTPADILIEYVSFPGISPQFYGAEGLQQQQEQMLNTSLAFVDAGGYMTSRAFGWVNEMRDSTFPGIISASFFWKAVERAGVDGIVTWKFRQTFSG
jgi:hypothetical protein